MTVHVPNQPPVAFQFKGYTVRQVSGMDRDFMAQLIALDEYHRDNMTPDFFLNLERGEDAWALEKNGKVLFYFKTQTAVRMGILFAGGTSREDRAENRAALLNGLAWIEAILAGNGFREILFDTDGPDLEAFAKRHLGFREAHGLLSRVIPTPKPPEAHGALWGTSPQSSQEAG